MGKEPEIKERVKNVLNYKKPKFWISLVAVVVVIASSFLLLGNRSVNQREIIDSDKNSINENPGIQSEKSDPESISVQFKETSYSKVKITLVKNTFLSNITKLNSAYQFETTDFKIVEYIDSSLSSNLTPSEKADLNNNHTNQYQIELSDKTEGYSCKLYYDTLYNKAYIVKDGGLYQIGTDFARYIDSFLESEGITLHIDDTDVVTLFKEYGWTLDYQINAMSNHLDNIETLWGFNPNSYYFAYNNELSKDIGLDMSKYSNATYIDVMIYRIHESMPQEFYPIQDCRGIVIKDNGKIIGAFISAGRHSTFYACSLKGNSFEKVTSKTLNQWLIGMVKADNTEKNLSQLEPKQVIEKYFLALEKKDTKTAGYLISKETLLESLTTNMTDDKLFIEEFRLPLTDWELGNETKKSAKLLKVELIDASKQNTQIFRVTLDLQYIQEDSSTNREQVWDCIMVYESPQTGWKIQEFGH